MHTDNDTCVQCKHVGLVDRVRTVDTMDGFYGEFGRRVTEARENASLSQGALGRRANLSRTSIVNIEKGRQRVLLHKAVELAEILKVGLPELLPPEPPLGLDEQAWMRRVLDQTMVQDGSGQSGS